MMPLFSKLTRSRKIPGRAQRERVPLTAAAADGQKKQRRIPRLGFLDARESGPRVQQRMNIHGAGAPGKSGRNAAQGARARASEIKSGLAPARGMRERRN